MSQAKAGNAVGSDPLPEEVSIQPAGSREDLEQAFRLVYKSYLQRGYVEADPSELRLSVFNRLPDTITFVGKLGGEVISTVSLVPDTGIGLPMDEVYHDELQALRSEGRRPAEVTMFADRRTNIKRTVPMLLSLMKLVFDCATLAMKANDLCITVNPRHVDFYSRYLLFTPMGDIKPYPSVCDNPALAERLDLDRVRQACEGNERLLRQFFENRTALKVFEERYRMTRDDLHYFGFELKPIFRTLPPKVADYLRKIRPDCPWGDW